MALVRIIPGDMGIAVEAAQLVGAYRISGSWASPVFIHDTTLEEFKFFKDYFKETRPEVRVEKQNRVNQWVPEWDHEPGNIPPTTKSGD